MSLAFGWGQGAQASRHSKVDAHAQTYVRLRLSLSIKSQHHIISHSMG